MSFRYLMIQLVLHFIFFNYSMGQSAFPTASDSLRWTFCTDFSAVADPGSESFTHEFYMIDTINICGHTYSIVEGEGQLLNLYEGYIRTEGKKVFLKTNTDCTDEEHLLYDFDMEPNIPVKTVWRTLHGLVEANVVLLNEDTIGNQRIMNMFYFSDHWPQYRNFEMKWIEGFGAEVHPFHPLVNLTDGCECSTEFLCLLDYNRSLPDSCKCEEPTVNTEYEKSTQTWTVYPNPTRNFLNIQFPQSVGSGSLRIFDPLGKTVLITDFQSDYINISTQFLSPGLYTLVWRDSYSHQYSKKFVKL